jgi:hypothetical protein
MDFTFKKYKELISALQNEGYSFQSFEDFIQKPKDKVVVLRHDVDRRSKHAIVQAKDERSLGIDATYYFRIVPESNDKTVIQSVVAMNHELGYHYEDLGMSKGNFPQAYRSFKKNLEYFRKFYNVKTICMHGSPENRIDNRDIWEKYDYKKSGIIAEPYFDVDYNEVFYITDAGRQWNNKSVSVRDKVTTKYDIPINSTNDIIERAKSDQLPSKIMINTHPHNWSNFGILWIYILVWQSLKNIVKYFLIRYRES